MKVNFSILLSVMFFSCTYSTAKKEKEPVIETIPEKVDTNYVRTGFYYLEEGGIRKKCITNGLLYSLAKTPFASVDNIIHTEIKMDTIGDHEVYPNLCLTFDEKGTKDLAEGTGNPLHPSVAAVIAGKLIYVVGNSTESKVTTGKMCLIMTGTTLELEAMKRAIQAKR